MARIKEISVSYNVKLNKDYNSIGTSIGFVAEVGKGENEKSLEAVLRKKCRISLRKEVTKLMAFLNAASSK